MNKQVGFTNSAQFRCLEDLQRDYMDLCLSYCGIEDCDSGFGFGPQRRAEYVIHVVSKGRGIFQSAGKTYRLEKNMAFLISPDITTYYEADSEDPWSYCWVGFNGLKSYECVINSGFTLEKPVINITCEKVLADCISKILDAHQLTYANELKRSSQLMLFLAALIEDHSAASPEHVNYDYPGSVYVKHAVNYLSLNYAKKIKINDLAKYIGINRSYLTNSFKKAMRISPQQFLVNLRMDKAASLLHNTSLPISSIALQVGYDDPLAFSKIFKLKYKVSPKVFRETPETLITTHNKGDDKIHSYDTP